MPATAAQAHTPAQHFAFASGRYIITANPDGSIPLNSRIAATIGDKDDRDAAGVLVAQANATAQAMKERGEAMKMCNEAHNKWEEAQEACRLRNAEIDELMQERGVGKADCILSGEPMTTTPPATGIATMIAEFIENLGYPVGMGLAPHPDSCRKLADAICNALAAQEEAK